MSLNPCIWNNMWNNSTFEHQYLILNTGLKIQNVEKLRFDIPWWFLPCIISSVCVINLNVKNSLKPDRNCQLTISVQCLQVKKNKCNFFTVNRKFLQIANDTHQPIPLSVYDLHRNKKKSVSKWYIFAFRLEVSFFKTMII